MRVKGTQKASRGRETSKGTGKGGRDRDKKWMKAGKGQRQQWQGSHRQRSSQDEGIQQQSNRKGIDKQEEGERKVKGENKEALRGRYMETGSEKQGGCVRVCASVRERYQQRIRHQTAAPQNSIILTKLCSELVSNYSIDEISGFKYNTGSKKMHMKFNR